MDDDVKFLEEVRIPCLICANPKEIDNLVKQEVTEIFEEDANPAQEPQNANDPDLNADHIAFQWFLNCFKVRIAKKGKQRLLAKDWDGQGGDILRFCENCKTELLEILEFQKEQDELQEKIANRLSKMKAKMKSIEPIFEQNGIYERDHRYKIVRSQIVQCAGPEQVTKSDVDAVITSVITAGVSASTVPNKMEPSLTQFSDLNSDSDVSSNISYETRFSAVALQAKKVKEAVKKKVPVRKSVRIRDTLSEKRPFVQKAIQNGNKKVKEAPLIRKSARLENKNVQKKKCCCEEDPFHPAIDTIKIEIE